MPTLCAIATEKQCRPWRLIDCQPAAAVATLVPCGHAQVTVAVQHTCDPTSVRSNTPQPCQPSPPHGYLVGAGPHRARASHHHPSPACGWPCFLILLPMSPWMTLSRPCRCPWMWCRWARGLPTEFMGDILGINGCKYTKIRIK